MLKKLYPDLNKRSAHYRKQAPFKGSNRQIRGNILKLLIRTKMLKKFEIDNKFKNISHEKLKTILIQLEKEGFIKTEGANVQIVK